MLVPAGVPAAYTNMGAKVAAIAPPAKTACLIAEPVFKPASLDYFRAPLRARASCVCKKGLARSTADPYPHRRLCRYMGGFFVFAASAT